MKANADAPRRKAERIQFIKSKDVEKWRNTNVHIHGGESGKSIASDVLKCEINRLSPVNEFVEEKLAVVTRPAT